jgi:23S rRNA pseudouridine1911/1915/1917 synthase
MQAQPEFTVSPEFKEKTLAHFLKNVMSDRTWSQIKSVIGAGGVTVDGKRRAKSDFRLKGNEKISVDLDRYQERGTTSDPSNKQIDRWPIEIVYLDAQVVVINKPSGITTMRHPYEIEEFGAKARFLPDTVAQKLPRIIEQYEGKKQRRGTAIPVKAVHRLDKETSGLLVFARTDKAASSLGKQFRAHTIVRKYAAIVVGEVTSQKIKTRIVRDRGDGRRGSQITGDGKMAITHVVAQENLQGYTLVECRLETGRTHQIRIHLAEIGHPICGELVYTRQFKQGRLEDASGARALMLHAGLLGFIHPTTEKYLEFTANPPKSFTRLLNSLQQRV